MFKKSKPISISILKKELNVIGSLLEERYIKHKIGSSLEEINISQPMLLDFFDFHSIRIKKAINPDADKKYIASKPLNISFTYNKGKPLSRFGLEFINNINGEK